MAPTQSITVYCRDCGKLVFAGEWDQEASDAAAGHPACSECGSTGREYRMEFEVKARARLSYKARLVGPEEGPDGGLREKQKQVGGEFARGDRKGYVHREMVVDKDHDPPYKWHRVTDENSGLVEKHQLEDFRSGEVWDLRDPSVEPPDWFLH